jgi:hypothetical protein
MTSAGDALEGLPAEARDRLEAFANAVDRVHVDDLLLHVGRRRQPGHRRSVERAALIAREAGLEAGVEEAKRLLNEAMLRTFSERQLRVWIGGVNMVPSSGPTDDRIRILESLGDAVTALVLWERLDAADRAELLGLWARLLP